MIPRIPRKEPRGATISFFFALALLIGFLWYLPYLNFPESKPKQQTNAHVTQKKEQYHPPKTKQESDVHNTGVPEPSSAILLGTGLIFLLLYRGRRRR